MNEHIQALEERANFLLKRMADSAFERTFDKREHAALMWVLGLARSYEKGAKQTTP